jgi:hypothetical protein
MDYDIHEERLFRKRNSVKKLVRLKKKGTKFAEKLDVPYEKLVEYKQSIKNDLEHSEEDYEVYTNFKEFSFRVSLEAEDPHKYKDLPKSKFVDINGKSHVTKMLTEYASDESMVEYFKKHKLSQNQQLFVINYIGCRNATESAKKAGYAPHSAHAKGYSLLQMPKIQKAIAMNLAKPLEKFNITPESLIQDLVVLKERAMEAHPVKDAQGNYLGTWKCDTKEALQAVKLLGDYLGMFNKHLHKHIGHDGGSIKHEHNIKYNLKALTDEELRFYEDRILPKIKIVEPKD